MFVHFRDVRQSYASHLLHPSVRASIDDVGLGLSPIPALLASSTWRVVRVRFLLAFALIYFVPVFIVRDPLHFTVVVTVYHSFVNVPEEGHRHFGPRTPFRIITTFPRLHVPVPP